MGKDKVREKLEKKRLKAQMKLEKKRRKGKDKDVLMPEPEPAPKPTPVEPVPVESEPKPGYEPKAESKQRPTQTSEIPSMPWYKNPEWVRAIVAIASLIVALTVLALQLSR